MSGSLSDAPTPPFSYTYTEFTPVKARKKRKNRPQRQQECSRLLLQHIKEKMSQDEWFSQCQSIVKDALKSLSVEGSVSVLCLGLGSPTASPVSRAQLAFLTELCSGLNIDHASVSIYDPVFTQEDLELFKWLRFQVLLEDKNAGYPLQGPTICYMPHCDMELYNSLFRANWSQDRILTLILLANRLEGYLENNAHHKLQERVPYLFRIAPILDDHPLPSSRAWPLAFNNTSLQYIRSPNNLPATCFSEVPDQTQAG